MATARTRLEVLRPAHGIDHVTITVSDYRRARRFYEQSLRPLGLAIAFDWPDGGRAYYGLPGEASSVWVVQGDDPGRARLSLAAAGRASVDTFHAAALAAGGRSRSLPALRPEYTPRTYAAEVLDPDGNTLEAICWRVELVTATAQHAA